MNNREFLEVEGKNVGRFLKRLNDNQINLYKIEMIHDSKMIILVDNKDLTKIDEIKTIYQVSYKTSVGLKKYISILKKNLLLIVLIILNFIFINIISNYIFEIEVIDNDTRIKQFILKELNENGIAKLSLKKNYAEIENIKKQILNENKDSLEWLEIVPSGVKYIVKIEERIKNPEKEAGSPSNIVAKKDGVVKKIIASNGQVVVTNNTYVKKGDILISGLIKLNEVEKNKVQAKGDVYAETWYKVTSEQSFHEQVDELTGNSKKGFRIQVFNNNYKLYKDYSSSLIKEKVLLKNNILPIYLYYDIIEERNYKDLILSYEETIAKAFEKARNKINKNLTGEEKIISEKQLKVILKDSKIIVDILFTVYEKISIEERIEVENVSWNF